jgi:hypothetical protein
VSCRHLFLKRGKALSGGDIDDTIACTKSFNVLNDNE